jgi:hypothetical protein
MKKEHINVFIPSLIVFCFCLVLAGFIVCYVSNMCVFSLK